MFEELESSANAPCTTDKCAALESGFATQRTVGERIDGPIIPVLVVPHGVDDVFPRFRRELGNEACGS